MAAEASPERSSTELEELERLLRLADGFVLAFVRANVPVVRDRLARELAERLILGEEPITVRILRLGESETDLLDEIDRLAPPLSQREALFVFGLEAGIPSDPERSAGVLERLNRQREAFRELPGPVVFFLPEYALTRLAREAPDFWAWRSGVFEIRVPTRDVEELLYATHPRNLHDYENLNKTQKISYFRVLRGLLEEIESSSPEEIEGRVAERIDLRSKLGWLSFLTGAANEGEQYLVSCVELAHRAGMKYEEANALRNWGRILCERGDYETALEKTQSSRDLFTQLGNRTAVAAASYSLGSIYLSRGELDRAITEFDEALSWFEQTANFAEVGIVSYEKARALRLQGQTDEAVEYFRRALEIAASLNDRHGTAVTFDQLGRIERDRDNLEQAQGYFEHALAMSRELGDRHVEALTLHELGQLNAWRGAHKEADRLFFESYSISREVGDTFLEGLNLLQEALLFAKDGRTDEAARFAANALATLHGQPQHWIEHAQNLVANIASIVGREEFQQALDRFFSNLGAEDEEDREASG